MSVSTAPRRRVSSPPERPIVERPTKRRPWGAPPRLVPDDVAADRSQATREIVRMLIGNYEAAARAVPGKRVLDIACGSGYGSQLLKSAGARQVVGVDLSDEAIAYAERRYGMPGIDYVCERAEAFTSAEPFDVAVSYETLQYFDPPQPFLKHLRSLLAPNGLLFVSFPLGKMPLDNNRLVIPTAQRACELLEESGFTVEACRRQEWTIGPKDFASWRQQYPQDQATLGDLLLSSRGRRLLWQLVLGRGSLTIRGMVIRARNAPPATKADAATVAAL